MYVRLNKFSPQYKLHYLLLTVESAIFIPEEPLKL